MTIWGLKCVDLWRKWLTHLRVKDGHKMIASWKSFMNVVNVVAQSRIFNQASRRLGEFRIISRFARFPWTALIQSDHTTLEHSISGFVFISQNMVNYGKSENEPRMEANLRSELTEASVCSFESENGDGSNNLKCEEEGMWWIPSSFPIKYYVVIIIVNEML